MLIGELARQAGLTPDTIRFYEKKGLLDAGHVARRENNYKDYDPAALERLRLIAQAKCAGFTLREIAQGLQEWDTLTPTEQRAIFSDRIAQIERRMAELEKMKAYLNAKIAASLAECSH